ncbi:Uncharacterized protein dnl_15930 [Desulfonema limicola]|uniref:Uncharacterized protein n=1 Tax=Desulfonema limicola TaxID=45656 RepID=A0A975B5T6_9BACT|nr:Uncharacterized protein dnl_15930 [Desulfonema limicola]
MRLEIFSLSIQKQLQIIFPPGFFIQKNNFITALHICQKII